MAGNFFDQFDAKPAAQPNAMPAGANFFDQFDKPAVTPAQAALAQQSPSFKDRLLRQIALAGRAAAEGATALPASFADFINGRSMANAILSKAGVPTAPSTSEEMAQALNAAGAYNPETPGEQLGSAVVRGTTGALAGGGVGGGMANALRAAASGATGGAASEVARQAGLPAPVQFVAGLAGGLAPAAIETTARGMINAARPLTVAGQNDMAANILANQATNREAAIANLEGAAPIVPNSARTTGEAAQDVGLLALEKGVRGRNPAPFGQRISEQNAARQAELGALGGTPADVAAAKAARDVETATMREAALSSAGEADTTPVFQTIKGILDSPSGKRESVSKAIEWAKGQIGDTKDPAALYEIRKDLQLAQAGKLQPSSPNAPNASTLALARGQLSKVVDSLDDQIEAAAPGFKAYLERYREMSGPIDQMKVIQEIQRRAQLTSADVTTGQQFLGNANFSRALDAALQKSGAKLTQDQTERLNAIRTDLQYGQAINSPLVKAPGSDTFQNLSIAQVLGAGPGSAHPALNVLGKPLAWVYKLAGSDERVNDLLAQAMLDPRLAASMLRRATPESMQRFSERLRMWAVTNGVAASAGSLATSQPRPAERSTQAAGLGQ